MYKVVTMIWVDSNPKLPRSVVVAGAAQVLYSEGEWVSAPEWLAKQGYHLLVFDTIAHARAFAWPIPSAHIWRCRTKGRVEKLPPMCISVSLQKGLLKKETTLKWPPGTVMVKGVCLTKRIY